MATSRVYRPIGHVVHSSQIWAGLLSRTQLTPGRLWFHLLYPAVRTQTMPANLQRLAVAVSTRLPGRLRLLLVRLLLVLLLLIELLLLLVLRVILYRGGLWCLA